jgi:hypothetical protein
LNTGSLALLRWPLSGISWTKPCCQSADISAKGLGQIDKCQRETFSRHRNKLIAQLRVLWLIALLMNSRYTNLMSTAHKCIHKNNEKVVIVCPAFIFITYIAVYGF